MATSTTDLVGAPASDRPVMAGHPPVSGGALDDGVNASVDMRFVIAGRDVVSASYQIARATEKEVRGELVADLRELADRIERSQPPRQHGD